MEQTTKTKPISLSQVPAGAEAIVRNISGGRGFVSRLATLGFTPGARLTVMQNYGRGPIIVCLRDSRIALGRGESAKVQVILDSQGANENCASAL